MSNNRPELAILHVLLQKRTTELFQPFLRDSRGALEGLSRDGAVLSLMRRRRVNNLEANVDAKRLIARLASILPTLVFLKPSQSPRWSKIIA